MWNVETLSYLNIEASSYCNAKCPQCPRFDMYGNITKNLNLTHLDKKIIFSLPIKKMVNLKEIDFCGNYGESLMHPDLDEMINFFNDYKITIKTNGSLRNKDWWKNLGKKKNIKSVTFALDGIEETHELYRRNTSYDKIIENAKIFIENGGHAIWQFIIFKHNEHQIEKAKQLSKDLGFKEIKFMFSERFDSNDVWKVYENSKHLYSLEQSTLQNKNFRNHWSNQKNEKYNRNLMKTKEIFEKEIQCPWAKNQSIYIDRNGYVLPCCYMLGITAGREIEKRLFEKIIKNFKNIDLNFYTLDEILSSSVYKEYFKNSLLTKPHPVCIETCNHILGKLEFKKQSTNLIEH